MERIKKLFDVGGSCGVGSGFKCSKTSLCYLTILLVLLVCSSFNDNFLCAFAAGLPSSSYDQNNNQNPNNNNPYYPFNPNQSNGSTLPYNYDNRENRDRGTFSQTQTQPVAALQSQYEDRDLREQADPNINWHAPNPFAPKKDQTSITDYYNPSIYGSNRHNISNTISPSVGSSGSSGSGFQSTIERDRERNLNTFPIINQNQQQNYDQQQFLAGQRGLAASGDQVDFNNNLFNQGDRRNWQNVGNQSADLNSPYWLNKNLGSSRENMVLPPNHPQNPQNFPQNPQNFPPPNKFPINPNPGSNQNQNQNLNPYDRGNYPSDQSGSVGFDQNYPFSFPNSTNQNRNWGNPANYPPNSQNFPNSNWNNSTWNNQQNIDLSLRPGQLGPTGQSGQIGTSGNRYPGTELFDPNHPTLTRNRPVNYPGHDVNQPDPSRNYLDGRDGNRQFNPSIAGGGSYPGLGQQYPGGGIPGQQPPGRTTPFFNVPGGAVPPGFPHNQNIPSGAFNPGWPYKNEWNEFWSTTTLRPLAPGVLGRWRPELQGQQRPEDINQVPYPVYVTTSYGRVQGFKVKIYDGPFTPIPSRPGIASVDKVQATVTSFVGIPYARAPTVEGRFRPPRPHPGWQLHQGVEFGPACPQPARYFGYTAGIVEVDEDCLFLSVYSPDVGSGVEGSPYPVLFYIHDGDFIQGASNQFPPHQLAAWYNVVVVTVNFRLGALGFLSTTDEHSPGNYGMLDLAMALKWTHQNIRSFNGDPERITLIGLGSGAGAAGLLMLSPKTRHLIKNVIALEGAPTADWAAIQDRYRLQNTTELYAYKMGCWDEYDTTSWKIVQCLRTRSWQELANLELEPDVGTFAWAPAVDYSFKVAKDDYYNNWKEEDWHFLPDTPQNLLRAGEYPFIKYMTGFSRQSAADLLYANKTLPNHIVTRDWFDMMILKWVKQYNYTLNPEGVFSAIKYAYTYWPDPLNTTHLREEYIDFLSDALYRSPVDETVKLLLARGIQVHQYLLNYTLEGLRLPFWREVPRDLTYYMLTGAPFMDPEFFPERLRVERSAWTEGDRNMSNFLMSAVANMAHYGHPTPREILGIFWERATPNEIKYLALNGTNNSTIQRNYRQRELTFWSEYMPSVVGHLVATYPPTTEFWWEPNEPLQIAFWTVSGICLLLIVMLVACCLLWRTAKNQRDRIYDDLGLGHPIGLGTIVGDEISDYAGSVKTADSLDSGVKMLQQESGTSFHPEGIHQSKPTSHQSMQLFTTQTHPHRPSNIHYSQPNLQAPRDRYPVPMKRAMLRSETPQTQV